MKDPLFRSSKEQADPAMVPSSADANGAIPSAPSFEAVDPSVASPDVDQLAVTALVGLRNSVAAAEARMEEVQALRQERDQLLDDTSRRLAGMRESIAAAEARLGELQALREERDHLHQELERSRQQLNMAHQRLEELNSLQLQLQQLLEPAQA
jgi:DNA repair exonuclease SbcCD ATPase subunit